MTFDYLSEHSDEDGKKIIKRLKVKSNWKSAWELKELYEVHKKKKKEIN